MMFNAAPGMGGMFGAGASLSNMIPTSTTTATTSINLSRRMPTMAAGSLNRQSHTEALDLFDDFAGGGGGYAGNKNSHI